MNEQIPVETITAKEPVQTKEMTVTENGSIALTSLSDQSAFAKRLIELKMISDTFKTVAQVIVGFQYAKALKMNEILALKMMYVVNGRPCLYGEGPLALVQRNPAFKKIREYYINEKGEEICPKNKNVVGAVYFGAVTEVWRAGDDEPQVDFFTREDLERTKLDFSKFGKKEVWDKWERIMMRYKARTMALRSKFADLIAGIPVAEYDHSFTPEVPEIRDAGSSPTVADEMNKTFSSGSEEIQ